MVFCFADATAPDPRAEVAAPDEAARSRLDVGSVQGFGEPAIPQAHSIDAAGVVLADHHSALIRYPLATDGVGRVRHHGVVSLSGWARRAALGGLE